MANKDNTKVLNAELQALSPELQELAIGVEDCFYRYKPKKFVGDSIYSELVRKYEADEKQFVFSDDFKKSGILSICQGLLSVIATVEKMGADNKKYDRVIDDLLNQLLKKTKAYGRYRIDASPYTSGADIFESHVYIDSATWIISTLLGIFRLYIKDKYEIDKEKLKEIVELYSYCMDAINNAYIKSNSKRKFLYGWNFTDGCAEPAIYFTFAVSEILIDILTTFENVIRNADVELIKQEILKELDKRGLFKSERFLNQKDRMSEVLAETSAKVGDSAIDIQTALDNGEFYAFTKDEKALVIEIWQKFRAIEEECKEYSDKIEKNSSEVQREKEIFALINKGCAPYDEKSAYSILEEHCKESANNIWNITKKDLANSFFASTLETTVSEEAIEASVSSDALFNSIMIVNILINAGIDEDADDKINYFTINGSEAFDEAITEYDSLRDILRLAYENCYQFFLRLQKKNKDYKVNEFTLNFDENFGKLDNEVRDLRKAHIRVFSLMPLLVRTKTTMGEFLIRYPQYDMQIFLEHILKSRSKNENDEYIWLWEKDYYSASSNYYFISSFASFYDYYETYELKFLPNANNNRTVRKEIEANYHKSLIEKGKAIEKDLAEFEKQENTIKALENELAEANEKLAELENDPLRSALVGFVSSVIRETVIDILAEQLSREAVRIVTTKKASVLSRAEEYTENKDEGDGKKNDKISISEWEKAPAPEKTDFEKAMNDILLAIFAENFGEAIYSGVPTKKEREDMLDKRLDSFDKYASLLGKDFRQALRYHFRGVVKNNRSDLVANEGESILSGGNHAVLMSMIEETKNKKGDKK